MRARTLILQSAAPEARHGWQGRCLASVASWARERGYDYRLLGDEFFAPVPAWYMTKVAGRLPIAADYARLVQARSLLEAGQADIVAWLDADVFVFAPDHLEVRLTLDAVFGRELWLELDAGKPRVHRNVHNAYAAFAAGSSTLSFLADRVLEMMARVDAEHIAPQFVGPKLLTSLHNIVGFDVVADVGAISPALADGIVERDARVLAAISRRAEGPMYAANLCASLARDPAAQDALIDRLVDVYSVGLPAPA